MKIENELSILLETLQQKLEIITEQRKRSEEAVKSTFSQEQYDANERNEIEKHERYEYQREKEHYDRSEIQRTESNIAELEKWNPSNEDLMSIKTRRLERARMVLVDLILQKPEPFIRRERSTRPTNITPSEMFEHDMYYRRKSYESLLSEEKKLVKMISELKA